MLPGSSTLGVGNVLGFDSITGTGNCSQTHLTSPQTLVSTLQESFFLPKFPPWPHLNVAVENMSSSVAGQASQLASCLKEVWGQGGTQRYLYISKSHDHF